jgi:hypothetical protein
VIGASHDYSFSGDYAGREQILDLFHRIDTDIEMHEHRILNIVVDGAAHWFDIAARRRAPGCLSATSCASATTGLRKFLNMAILAG